jgi:TolB protein
MWSPDGNNIAFLAAETVMLRSISWIERKMSGELPTTRPRTDGCSWSADGARLVFQSNRDGNWEIYSTEIDQLTRLTDNLSDDSSPAWSPDGKQIVFTSNRAGRQNIFVMREDGAQVVQLTNTVADDSEPSWSPDGKRSFYEPA